MKCCVVSAFSSEYPFYRGLSAKEKTKCFEELFGSIGKLICLGCKEFIFGSSDIGDNYAFNAVEFYRLSGENVIAVADICGEHIITKGNDLDDVLDVKKSESFIEKTKSMIDRSDYILLVWNNNSFSPIYAVIDYAQDNMKPIFYVSVI